MDDLCVLAKKAGIFTLVESTTNLNYSVQLIDKSMTSIIIQHPYITQYSTTIVDTTTPKTTIIFTYKDPIIARFSLAKLFEDLSNYNFYEEYKLKFMECKL